MSRFYDESLVDRYFTDREASFEPEIDSIHQNFTEIRPTRPATADGKRW
jgi:hypothetical protein